MADSAQTLPVVVRKQSGLLSGLASWQGVAILLLLVWLYAPIIAGLYTQWSHDEDFGYIPFVPLFSAFVVWQSRKKLSAIPAEPSWTGIAIVFAALGILVLGQLGAEVFSTRFSLVILVAGLIISIK